VVERDRLEVIAEHRNATVTSDDDGDEDSVALIESVGEQIEHWQKLAGVTK
jgi:hypothetical protein